jgi:hypothetical protein
MSTNTEKLKSKSQRAIEAIEAQARQRVAPRQQRPRPHTERAGAGTNQADENRRRLAAQLKARILAAEKAGNANMATKERKNLARLLTQKL